MGIYWDPQYTLKNAACGLERGTWPENIVEGDVRETFCHLEVGRDSQSKKQSWSYSRDGPHIHQLVPGCPRHTGQEPSRSSLHGGRSAGVSQGWECGPPWRVSRATPASFCVLWWLSSPTAWRSRASDDRDMAKGPQVLEVLLGESSQEGCWKETSGLEIKLCGYVCVSSHWDFGV